jgi:hypothetical protein
VDVPVKKYGVRNATVQRSGTELQPVLAPERVLPLRSNTAQRTCACVAVNSVMPAQDDRANLITVAYSARRNPSNRDRCAATSANTSSPCISPV